MTEPQSIWCCLMQTMMKLYPLDLNVVGPPANYKADVATTRNANAIRMVKQAFRARELAMCGSLGVSMSLSGPREPQITRSLLHRPPDCEGKCCEGFDV